MEFKRIAFGKCIVDKAVIDLALLQFLETVSLKSDGDLTVAALDELFHYCQKMCHQIPLSTEVIQNLKY